MSSRQLRSLTGILGALIVMAGCAGGSSSDEAGATSKRRNTRLQVYVVNYPLQYFAERIGGEHVRVEFPAPTDVDPAFWRPSAEEVTGYQNADLVLLNGADYAKWLDSVSLPYSTIWNTSDSCSDLYIPIEEVETHAHGPAGEHEHGGFAFTTWLDLTTALEQARAIEAAFRDAMPAAAEDFGSGLESLERDLLDLDRELREVVGGRKLPLMGSHPVYQYLAQEYELEIVSVHFEPDEYPGEDAWDQLRELLEQRPARWMLWEGSPLERTTARLRELGLESVVYDPCGNRPTKGDFLTVQRANIENLREIYHAGS